MKQKNQGTADPTKDHHFINGQLVPVVESRSRPASSSSASSRRKPATKPKGLEPHKSPD